MTSCPITHPEPPCESTEPPPGCQELWLRYLQRADNSAENALVEQYLPLVRSVLGRLAISLPRHVDPDDLNSAGLLGLLQALRNYDPSCDTAFEAYARLRIRGAMLDELRHMDWVPRTVHEKARRLQDAVMRLEQELGHTPTGVEVARALRLSPSEYEELLNDVRPATFVCLDAVGPDQDGPGLAEAISDPAQTGPLEEVSHNELKQLIRERLADLPPQQRKVMALYYGEGLNLREIALLLGLTESRICQVHSQAILSIRAYIQRVENGVAAVRAKRTEPPALAARQLGLQSCSAAA